MSREEILERIIETIHACFPETEELSLTEDTEFIRDTPIDSLGFTLIVCRLESLLGISIPGRSWNELQTLGDLADAVCQRLPGKDS